MNVITEKEAVALIHGTAGKVFSCTFVKRSNGEIREGRFRLGSTVKKGLKGGPAAYNPADYDLIWVYRMAGDESENPGQRRSIPADGIVCLTVGGEDYVVARTGASVSKILAKVSS